MTGEISSAAASLRSLDRAAVAWLEARFEVRATVDARLPRRCLEVRLGSENVRSLRNLIKDGPTSKDVDYVFREIESATPRAAAILAATLLDLMLENVIESHFAIELSKRDKASVFEGYGPLSTLSAKIKIGYALGFYDSSTRSYFDIIRIIRNAFAHTIKEIDFETPEVRTEVDKLVEGAKKKIDSLNKEVDGKRSRERFNIAVRAIILYLIIHGLDFTNRESRKRLSGPPM